MMFGEYLIRIGALERPELDEALEAQRFRPQKIGRILRDLDVISEEDLNRYLEGYQSPREKKSVTELEAKERLKTISSEIINWSEKIGVVPWNESNTEIEFLAAAFCDSWLEEAEKRFGKICTLHLVDSDIYLYLRNVLFGQDSIHSLQVSSPVDLDNTQKDSPYTSLFRDVLDAAQKEKASDIHLQPETDGIAIRLRVHGDLKTFKTLSLEHRQSFMNEAKRMCGFSIALSGVDQDGRISFAGRKLDLRASLIPTHYGEKVVLRLLDLSQYFRLSESGLEPNALSDLRDALRVKNGILIVSGPTGSGKTSLLYRLLCELDRVKKNIITIEDPIEYRIPGISQTQVSSKLSFARALRSILRQDPDVILVGEIRDSETADLAVKAACTGHLVLSTLHANSAPEVVSRLLGLGVDREILASCLKFSAAQRLLQKICPTCSVTPPDEIKKQFDLSSRDALRMKNPEGCSQCQGGVVGRKPVLEYLMPAQVQTFLAERKTAPSWPTLKQLALSLAEKGEVDAFESIELE
jgi:type IV pilus assembly protein PilB